MINSEYVLLAGILFLIVLDLARNRFRSNNKGITHYATLAVLVLAFIVEIVSGNMNVPFFSSTQYSQFINGFILFIAVMIDIFLLADNKDYSAYIDILLVLAVLGATLVVLSSNLISLVIAIELISISSYGLAFFQKTDARMEGAMKYVSISFLSVVIMIFGVSLVYGGTGSLSFSNTRAVDYIPFIAGVGILIVGLSFKSTIVPFHMWAPDVYEASNGAVTAFLSSISKTAGLVALIRVFFFAFQISSDFVSTMFFILAIATIFFASFLATVQDRIKRLLAYSSIAQAGFAFIAIGLLRTGAESAAVFYIFSFAIADALVFLAYKLFEDKGIVLLKDGYKMPSVSKIGTACLFIGVLSLFGLPPTIGFFGKLLIFTSLLSSGYVYLVLALFAILLYSTFYYFNLLGKLWGKTGSGTATKTGRLRVKEAVLIVLTMALFIGVWFIQAI